MGGSGHDRRSDECAEAVTGFPAEIAFLSRHGVAPSDLAFAARQASRNGTEPAREVLALGLIDEDGFYRAFAAELDLPFHTGDFALMPGGEHGAILRGGIAPVTGEASRRFRFVLAPEGPALRRMLEAGPRQRSDIAVVTPRRFGDALRRANGATLARRAANLDEAGLARDSARTGASRGQRIAAAIGAASAAIGGIFAPLETFFAVALLLGPVFLGLILLRLAAAIEQPAPDLWQRHRWRVDDSRLPVYTVAVPLYREEAVLQQMLAALTALDYPAAKLDIRLLIEAEDTGMQAALAHIALPSHVSVTIVPPGLPRTKPRALNLALLEARGTLFTIFDAEDIPDPQQLRMAAARFLRAPEDLACLQARLVIDHADEGLLPALFALEYAGLFEVLNPGLLALRAADHAGRHLEPFPDHAPAGDRRLGCLERDGGCRSRPAPRSGRVSHGRSAFRHPRGGTADPPCLAEATLALDQGLHADAGDAFAGADPAAARGRLAGDARLPVALPRHGRDSARPIRSSPSRHSWPIARARCSRRPVRSAA